MNELNPIYAAAAEIAAFFEERGWEYCFIGGLAIQRWGETRLTRDADCSLLTGFGDEEKFVDPLLAYFEASRPRAREIALQNRVLFLQASNGIHLDVALSAIPFEKQCIARSTLWEARPGLKLRLCSAEDLVVHKAYANRDRDWIDLEGVLLSQRDKLDFIRIFDDLRPLIELKDRPDIELRLKTLAQKCGLP